MKLKTLALTILMISFIIPAAMAQEDVVTMDIARFVLCEDIQDREPVNILENVPPGIDKIYAFLEAKNISADTRVNFVWLFEGEEVGSVDLRVAEGSRWRTFSSKKLTGRQGAWRVELQDPSGTVLAAIDFTVQ